MRLLLDRLKQIVADRKVRRAVERYKRKMRHLDRQDVPEDFREAAKGKAERKLGETIQQYVDGT